jgi:hypothetical protein
VADHSRVGYLHPEKAAIKAVIDRRNQRKLKDTGIQEQAGEQLMHVMYVM